MARPLRGGGDKGLVTEKTELFMQLLKNPKKYPQKFVATKLEGGKALVAGPPKEITCFSVFHTYYLKIVNFADPR